MDKEEKISRQDLIHGFARLIELANNVLEKKIYEMSNRELREVIQASQQGKIMLEGGQLDNEHIKRQVSKRTRFYILERDNFTCRYCGAKAPDVKLHIDHIKPWSYGGMSGVDNLCVSCEFCNQGKSNLYDTSKKCQE